MTNTEKRAEGASPLVYPCRLPLSKSIVNHLADLLRHHLKAIRSRWRILPPGRNAWWVVVWAVLGGHVGVLLVVVGVWLGWCVAGGVVGLCWRVAGGGVRGCGVGALCPS